MLLYNAGRESDFLAVELVSGHIQVYLLVSLNACLTKFLVAKTKKRDREGGELNPSHEEDQSLPGRKGVVGSDD